MLPNRTSGACSERECSANGADSPSFDVQDDQVRMVPPGQFEPLGGAGGGKSPQSATLQGRLQDFASLLGRIDDQHALLAVQSNTLHGVAEPDILVRSSRSAGSDREKTSAGGSENNDCRVPCQSGFSRNRKRVAGFLTKVCHCFAEAVWFSLSGTASTKQWHTTTQRKVRPNHPAQSTHFHQSTPAPGAAAGRFPRAKARRFGLPRRRPRVRGISAP